jgi:hypothetical protein
VEVIVRLFFVALAVGMVIGSNTSLAQAAAPGSSGFSSAPASSGAASGVSSAVSSAPSVSAQKRYTEVGFLSGYYSTVEMRHHLNTYYDQEGYLATREPSMHLRLQLGLQLYGGLVDTYATLGIYKLPESQQVLQRRPELALDIYPVRNMYFTLLQYNLVQLPYKKSDATNSDSIDVANDEEKSSDEVDGTVYTLGLAPTAKWPMALGSSILELKAGIDGWTRLYSQRQYTGNYNDEFDDEDGGRFSLDESAKSSEAAGVKEEPIEDYAMHYQTQYMAGFAFKMGFFPDLSSEVTINHNSRFDPVYTRSEDGGVEYKYGADRYSFYRWRLQYEMSSRVSLINDFYHFHDGFFAGERSGSDRRFRNIARITCRL